MTIGEDSFDPVISEPTFGPGPPADLPPDPVDDRGGSRKLLVKIDEGVYVDPYQLSSVRSISMGRFGFVRVSLLNGETFDVRRHELGDGPEPDASQAKMLMEDVQAQVRIARHR